MKSMRLLTVIIFGLLLCAMSGAMEVNPFFNPAFMAKRIVSLSPSVTDQLNDLGAADLLVGVTPWNPEYKGPAVIVGDYLRPDIEKILGLRPDVVLLSDEDSVQSSVIPGRFGLRCIRFGRVKGFQDICRNYMQLASMTGTGIDAEKKIQSYKERLSRIKRPGPALRVVFLVSARPLITVSGASYITSIISDAGGTNIYESERNPYPILNLESLVTSGADIVLVMNPDDCNYVKDMVKDFKSAEFVKMKNIYATGDTTVPYYSPGKYVESAELFAKIFSGMNR